MTSREWPATLDVDHLLVGGWRPVPLHQFILKVHSRCNLACDYCYMYTAADQSWRGRPRLMPDRVIAAVARRISEHAVRHGLCDVRLILHGGEPLLAGVEYLADTVRRIRTACAPSTRVHAVVQTNATLLTRDGLRILRDLGIRVGVSIDGGPEATDRHRLYPDGRGGYTDVARGLRRLMSPEFQEIYGGLLCTIDLANDPVRTHTELLAFHPPMIDYMLPHATWESPPERPGGHADWLIAVFDHWYGGNQRVRVRLFDEIITLLLGGTGTGEDVGHAPASMVVIETDGAIEQVDSLKVVAEGAPATGMNVIDHTFDEALRHPGLVARQLGREALCRTCLDCPVGRVCGGGQYPHRYAPGTGHLNPSVYCPDLFRLIGHIRGRVQEDLVRIRAER